MCKKTSKQQNISCNIEHPTPSQPKIKQNPQHHIPPCIYQRLFPNIWVLPKHRQNMKWFLLHALSTSEHRKVHSLSRHTSVWQKEVFPGSVTSETEGFPRSFHLDEGATFTQNKHILHLGTVGVSGWQGEAGGPLVTASPECSPLLSSKLGRFHEQCPITRVLCHALASRLKDADENNFSCRSSESFLHRERFH